MTGLQQFFDSGFKRRRRTPTIIQMEVAECGAASLAIILGYYGKFVPLDQLRVECGVTRDGSNAANILSAARRHGCTAKGFKKSIKKLREMTLPVIVYWDFKHFLVVEGFGDKWVYLNDPALGPRTVTHEEFDRLFSGLILAIEPGPDFQPGGSRPSFHKSLISRLRGLEKDLRAIFLFSLLLLVPGLAVPLLLRLFVDRVLVGSGGGSLLALVAGMGLAVAARAVLTWIQQGRLLRLETELVVSMTSELLQRIFRLPLHFFLHRDAGEIGSRVKISERLGALLSRELATNLLNALVALFFLSLMWSYDVGATLISAGIAAMNLGVLHWVSRMRVDANQKLMQERGKLVGVSMAGLRMIETYKATGSESDFFGQWSGYHARLLNAEQELGLPTIVLSATPSFLAGLNMVAVLALCGARVVEGSMSPGAFAAFQFLVLSFSEPIGRLVSLGAQLQEVEGGLQRLDDLLNQPECCDAVPVRNASSSSSSASSSYSAGSIGSRLKLNGRVGLKGVSFGYSPADPPLIRDFDLTIKPGQRIALIGPTGCGKSTIARLVCGLYEPWEGEILFDGKSRREIPSIVLSSSIAMVDQDVLLFEGSVRENLTLWDGSTPEADIIRAAKDACIHADITRRRNGYESRVEEGGRNFSGGQRQRMEIARALVNNPAVLVLDEATSALDPGTEAAIDENLRRRGCTCLIVAHRLSTIRDCDEIIVLDEGKVVQRGRHEDLAWIEGPYAELVRNDFIE